MKLQLYNPEIYPRMMLVCFDPDEKILNKRYSFDDDNIIVRDDVTFGDGLTISNLMEKSTRKYVIGVFFKSETFSPGLAAHEAYHFARRLFEQIGEKNASNEAFAYLIEWAVDRIYETLNIKNEKQTGDN